MGRGIRKLGLALLVGLLGFGSVPPARSADEPGAIDGQAEAVVLQRNVAQARQEALSKALTSVNLLQAERLLPPPMWLANRDIVTRKLSGDPQPYIQDFRVLREETSGGILRVEVRAVPRPGKLREDLLKWGVLYDRVRRPRIAVDVLEERRQGGGSAGHPSPAWTRRLAKRFEGLGFPPAGEGADVTVKGSFSPYGDRSVSVQLTVSRGSPPLELSRLSGNYALDSGPDTAAGLIASALLEGLLPAWFRESGEGREFTVAVSGLKSYRQVAELEEAFNSGRDGFASGMERTYARGFVSFGVVYGGSMAELVPALGRIRLTGGRVHVTDVRGQTVSATIR